MFHKNNSITALKTGYKCKHLLTKNLTKDMSVEKYKKTILELWVENDE